MCLIVFAWRPGHAQPLVLAANRDEFHARATQPLGEWADNPGLYAGRDLQAGGTWLGITVEGRFAALTNIRDPRQPPGERSRGELPVGFLHSQQSPEQYLREVAGQADTYGGFNLLVGNRDALWFLNAQEGQPRALPSGLHGVSNAGLDTPWPKLQRAKAALAATLDEPRPQHLLELLADPTRAADADLPDTGIGLSGERLLSSIFIHSEGYGTRASSVLLVAADGSQRFIERSFDNQGQACGDVELVLPGSIG
ncbi:NRDE family protein [Pseudomonas sp. Marseille-Q8238]